MLKNDNTVTITGVKEGSTVITVSQAAGTNHTAPSDQTFIATVTLSLENFSWTEISTISQNGQGDLYFDIGDTKEITLNGNIGKKLTLSDTKLFVFILHFNYPMNGTPENNIIWGGFKSELTGGTDVALADEYYQYPSGSFGVTFNMNHWGNNNYGGWKGSDLRYDILGATGTPPSDYGKEHTTSNEGYDATAATLTDPKADTLLAALPADFRNVLRLWTRWVDAVGNNLNVEESIKATVDAVTLLSEFEICGSRHYANQYEQNHQIQMAYYSAGNDTTHFLHHDTSKAAFWKTCSPAFLESGNANYFSDIAWNGQINFGNALGVNAIAPAFKT